MPARSVGDDEDADDRREHHARSQPFAGHSHDAARCGLFVHGVARLTNADHRATPTLPRHARRRVPSGDEPMLAYVTDRAKK
jgi:hypothetical protein